MAGVVLLGSRRRTRGARGDLQRGRSVVAHIASGNVHSYVCGVLVLQLARLEIFSTQLKMLEQKKRQENSGALFCSAFDQVEKSDLHLDVRFASFPTCEIIHIVEMRITERKVLVFFFRSKCGETFEISDFPAQQQKSVFFFKFPFYHNFLRSR